MKDFNRDQSDFVQSMGKGFGEERFYSSVGFWFFIGLGCLLLLLVLIYIAYLNRRYLTGRWLYFAKKFKGETVSTDRQPLKWAVTILLPQGGENTFRTVTTNVSPNGMFIKMPTPIPNGERVKYLLDLPGDDFIRGYAEVMWIQPNWSEHHPAGMGCKFMNLTPEQKNKLKLILRGKR